MECIKGAKAACSHVNLDAQALCFATVKEAKAICSRATLEAKAIYLEMVKEAKKDLHMLHAREQSDMLYGYQRYRDPQGLPGQAAAKGTW